MPSSPRNRASRKRSLPANGGNDAQLSGNTAQRAAVPYYAGQELPPETERIGDILRHRRQQRGDDLQQIADYLCIRKSFLIALENNNYDELPADAYVIGFLRTYAAYLGFDGGDAINRYRDEMAGRRRKPILLLPTPIAEGRTPSALVMTGAAATAVLIYALWYGFSAADRSIVSTPPPLPVAEAGNTAVPPEKPTASVTPGGIALAAPPEPAAVIPPLPQHAPPEVPVPVPSPAASPAANPPDGQAVQVTHLAIRAEKESWVVVADGNGHTLLDRVMKPGDVFPVPDTEGLKLTTGNSGGIVLVLDGKDLPKLAHNSSILHDIPLDIGKLGAPASKTPVETQE